VAAGRIRRLARRLAGALLTALFFEVGKAAIGFYIGKQGLESTYGAAASIVVVLIWVYYTSQIILMGAEITHAYAKHKGQRSSSGREKMSGPCRQPDDGPGRAGPRASASTGTARLGEAGQWRTNLWLGSPVPSHDQQHGRVEFTP
jgi:Virulence factor BrkB